VLHEAGAFDGRVRMHTGTMGYARWKATARKPYWHTCWSVMSAKTLLLQKWYGMKATTPIISGGMNALRLPGFFKNLGHGNVINTCGGGAFGHIDSPAAGGISLGQSYECWKTGADPIEYAKTHKSSPARSNRSRKMR